MSIHSVPQEKFNTILLSAIQCWHQNLDGQLQKAQKTPHFSKKKSALNFHITAGIGAGSREMSDQRTQPEINKITKSFLLSKTATQTLSEGKRLLIFVIWLDLSW